MAAIIKRRYLREVDLPIPIPSGTAMLFMQSAAPTGWTKSTTHNDKAIRIVSGTGGGSGGSSAFSTVFGKTATDNTTLTTAQIPSHQHANTLNYRVEGTGANSAGFEDSSPTVVGPVAWSTAAAGSGGAHSHGMDIRVQYVDAIICTKD